MGINKPVGSASFSSLFNKCKHAAKQRNLEFNLSREEHKAIIIQRCHYCDALPIKYNSYLKDNGTNQVRPDRYTVYSIERNWVEASGVDRVDNNLGYKFNNCVPCCKICNYLKCDMGYQEFVTWISKAYGHLKYKGIV